MENIYKHFSYSNSVINSYFNTFPKAVQVQTSNKCNAACTFCPYNHTEAKKKFEIMEWKIYKKIIDECSEHNVQQILPFFLNEPLLNKELIRYINYAKEKNPNSAVKIFTNGSLLTNIKSKELLDSKIDEVIFSFNGSTKEEYESVMKPLKFDEIKEKITNFIRLKGKNKKPAIAIHMLKLGLSDSSLNKIRDYWNNIGVTVHFLKYENRAGNVQDYNIANSTSVRKVPCDRLLNQIYIMVNGDVVLCCADWKNEVILGNIRNQSVYSIWNDKKRMEYVMAHLESNFSDLKLCDICNFNEIIL